MQSYMHMRCQARQLDSYSSARHCLTARASTARQLLDRPRQTSTDLDKTRRTGTWSQPRQARQGSTGKASTTGSTAPRRSLDSSTARQPGLKGRCVTVPPINLENNAVERSVCVGTAHWGDAAPRCWSFLVLAFKGDRPAPSREARAQTHTAETAHTHKPRRRTREALTELIRRGSPNA